jgi:phosphonate transport system permease protein
MERGKIDLFPKRQKRIFMMILPAVLILFVASLLQLRLQFFGGLPSIGRAFSFMFRMIAMDASLWPDVLMAALQSLSVAVLATIISALCAFFLGFFAAHNVSNKWFVWFLKASASVIRSVPTLVWALIFVAFLGFGPFAGVLGLFFHSFAYLLKAYSQSIEEVSPGCIEAMKATGASWPQIMARGVVPTAKTAFISWTALRFEFNIGQSTILGLVGAGGIGHELSFTMRNFAFEKGGFVVLVIFFMSFGVEMLFQRLKLGQDRRFLRTN